MPDNKDLPPELQTRGHAALPVKWADRAQYHSAAMPEGNKAPGGGARPTVTLLNATPDPLGSLAALCGIYEGKVVRRLADVTDDDRRAAWEAMRATVLNGPLESIQFHFLVEGVTRAFTHQAVRNRFSFFAQESMRFAVVDDERWTERQAYPPSLAAKPVQSHLKVHMGADGMDWEDNPDYGPDEHAYALKRDAWDDAVLVAEQAYKRLVEAGVPAEEARGLMPHSITTRYHWVVNIRALLGEAGKRLCTQAQFEWRVVMAEVVKALRAPGIGNPYRGREHMERGTSSYDTWQFQLMADALQPVCYQEGKCGFMARFDRGCTIRSRVEENARIGRPSSEWHEQWNGPDPNSPTGAEGAIYPIQPVEWLANPAAART
jgi:flavin-dependent thymidylate synthase